mmetsp:Transcript_114641/g.228133  ORF Transcript_114641/g.228133 Transcript_114641/m.228133 type:complete len:541 (-) Transcript_114641:383-2005(-)
MAVAVSGPGGDSSIQATPSARMYLSIAMAMVGAMMFGLDQGNFGNVATFLSFRKEWCVDRYGDRETCIHLKTAALDKEWEDVFVMWGATLITLGAAAGALLLAPWLANKHGRRPCIAAGGAICFVGCLMASYLSFGIQAVFFIGRFCTGFGVGVSCFALPVYNAEVSTPSIRGATGSLFQLNVVIGGFVACVITLLNDHWKFGMMLPGFAGFILMCVMPFMPESPRFIMERKGYEAGVKELMKVRTGDVAEEANIMRDEIKKEQDVEQVSYKELVCGDPNLRKRLFIACTLVLGQQATGVNAFLGYAATIFKMCGIEDPLSFNVAFNFVMFFGCLAGLLLVDSRFGGRKCQLLAATVFMGPPLVLAGFTLMYILPRDAAKDVTTSTVMPSTAMPVLPVLPLSTVATTTVMQDTQQDGLLPLAHIVTMVCVIIYGVGYQFAWGTVPWIYPAEIFSMSEKGKAVSVAVCLNYVANAAVVIITPFLMTWSTPGTLFFFGALNCLNFVFVSLFVKETKGVPLEEAPGLFDDDEYEWTDESDSEE